MSREDVLQTRPLIIAGPCSVASKEQIHRIGKEVEEMGANVLKAMLWKPRTKPGTFQGVGDEGIEWLAELKEQINIPITTEVMSVEHIKKVQDVVDILWVGSRNMQNFDLLKALSEQEKPVILKRGLIANIKEWVGAAEYIGTERVIMCERGIRTGADSMRFTMDLNAMLVAKHDHGLPVIVDPSHTAGRRDMVPHLALAAITAGADGLVIETHFNPEEELVDRDQTISIETLGKIISRSGKLAKLTEI